MIEHQNTIYNRKQTPFAYFPEIVNPYCVYTVLLNSTKMEFKTSTSNMNAASMSVLIY